MSRRSLAFYGIKCISSSHPTSNVSQYSSIRNFLIINALDDIKEFGAPIQ